MNMIDMAYLFIMIGDLKFFSNIIKTSLLKQYNLNMRMICIQKWIIHIFTVGEVRI